MAGGVVVGSKRGAFGNAIRVAMVGALALSSCADGDKTDADTTALIAEAQALTPGNIDAKANEISQNDYSMMRSLMAAGGLDAELGGAAQGDAALRALMVQLRQQMLGAQADLPRLIKIADGHAPGFVALGSSLFAGIAGAQTLAMQAARSDEPRGTFGDAPTAPGSAPTNDKGILTSGSFDERQAQFQSTFDTEVDGLKGRTTTKVRLDLCPKADGAIDAEFTSETALASRTGAAGARVKVTGKARWFVTDDARLGDNFETDIRVENAAFGGSQGANDSFVDFTEKQSSTSRAGNTAVINRASSRATPDDAAIAQASARLAQTPLLAIAHQAQDVFQSGRCVKLEPTTDPAKRSGAKPKTSFAILAAPRSKIDGTPTGGSVTATLSGAGSLDPAGSKVPADAKFTYVAGDKNTKGSVAFEARSKRGIGKATLAFDTGGRGYKAVGGGGDWSGSGLICSLTEPFAISGQGLTNSFRPSSETGGSYTLSGAFQGKWQSSGSGSYSVSVDEQGGTLKANGTGRVTMMGRALKAYPHSATFKLTPTDECP